MDYAGKIMPEQTPCPCSDLQILRNDFKHFASKLGGVETYIAAFREEEIPKLRDKIYVLESHHREETAALKYEINNLGKLVKVLTRIAWIIAGVGGMFASPDLYKLIMMLIKNAP